MDVRLMTDPEEVRMRLWLDELEERCTEEQQTKRKTLTNQTKPKKHF